jgi:hypothetical protein
LTASQKKQNIHHAMKKPKMIQEQEARHAQFLEEVEQGLWDIKEVRSADGKVVAKSYYKKSTNLGGFKKPT